MKPRNFDIASLATICLAICFAAGCAVGPNYHPPKIDAPAQFSNGAQDGFTTNQPVAAWWATFHDAELSKLVEWAATSNLDLRVATANLLEARALRLGAKSDFLPVANGVASYSHNTYSEAELFNAPGGEARRQELYDIGFDATWELDFFGRVRRSYAASVADVQAQDNARHDLLISVAAEVARNYFELRGAQGELEVLRRNKDNQAATLDLTKARLDAGGGTELEVAQARAEVNNTLAAIPPVEAAIAHAIHRLGVLTGRQPESLSTELWQSNSLPALPELIAIGDPAQLIRRRPDVRAAERNLAAATQRIGVAVADLFPRVTFNGQIGLQAESFAGLGRPGADANSFGPSITWAALDYGHIRSRIVAAHARTDAQLAQYEKTVLTSLEETENALVDYGRARERREYLAESVKASQAAADLSRSRYDNGATDFLTVLDAERVLLQAQDQFAQTETQTATALIAVYKALGGGWENN
ncbi:MAG TPA: efflux transporter outer membrane subunit [Verrucomicrobiae bacterium]|jgi:multidrug efflux system outer membrane protein|nr:efflux transporter outer membrane subunit [Verrucomicrobiae bacterium]